MGTQTLNAELSGTLALGGDLPVHRLGFGAMRITGPGIIGPPADPDEARATLRRAVELGTTFIDTAESYGPHVSEQLIAEALFPYPSNLVIATKGGLDRPGPGAWVPNGRPERLQEELHGSLRRLRLDRIDLYQLHRIDPQVPEDEQFGALQHWQQQGLIRHVGLSEATIEQIERAGRFFPVVSVQNRYNITDRQWQEEADYCHQRGIAFIPWRPLEVPEGDGHAIRRIADRHDATPSQIALAWLLQHSPVMLPIPGTSRRDHLEANIAACAITLSADEVRELNGDGGAKPRPTD